MLRWAVYGVLTYLAVMLVYGTLFRNAQPWLFVPLVVAMVAFVCIVGNTVVRWWQGDRRLPKG